MNSMVVTVTMLIQGVFKEEVYTRKIHFLLPNQQYQSTAG